MLLEESVGGETRGSENGGDLESRGRDVKPLELGESAEIRELMEHVKSKNLNLDPDELRENAEYRDLLKFAKELTEVEEKEEKKERKIRRNLGSGWNV